MKWCPIPFAKRYEVSEFGDVRRVKRIHMYLPGPIKINVRRGGYLGCAITYDDGSHKTPFVHALVAAAFIGPRPVGFHVCHNDGNKRNNHWTNLRYDTPFSNAADSRKHGTQASGSRVHGSKLTDSSVSEIKRLLIETPISLTAIAEMFGVNKSAVMRIRQFKTWRHIAPCEDLSAQRHADASQVAKSRTGTRWPGQRPDMQRLGLARPTDKKRLSASGRHERVWEVVR